MRRVGKGCSGVETLLFEGMIVEQLVGEGADEVHDEGVPTASVAAEGAVSAADDVVPTAVDEPSIPSSTPPTLPPQPSQDIPLTSQVQLTPPQSPQAQQQSPQQQQPQPSQDAGISMDLLHNLLDICTTLTRRVEHLEQDKIAQALEITKLKQRVKKLERRNKLKVFKLRRLKKVGTAQKVETSDDTVMDDVSKQGRIIANMDADKDGRKVESQAQIYQINLEHADKVLSMQDDDVEPAKLQELVEVVTTAKFITEVVTAASATITAAPQLTTATAPTLTTAPKISNIMIYLRNVVGFKMDYFKGMTYDDIRPIFEKYINSNVAFLQKTKEHMDKEDSRALKRLSETQEEKAAKKQKLDEEVKELRRHLQIVPNDEVDVYIEATPLARKVPVVDYEIYNENNKPYYKIKRAEGERKPRKGQKSDQNRTKTGSESKPGKV
nr:hypothetical protein [Tanacetum cinerariifolium]